MQRRHFEAIAEAIRQARRANPYPGAAENDAYVLACNNLETELVSAIRRFNGNFDVGRFREACAVSTSYRNKSNGRNSA